MSDVSNEPGPREAPPTQAGQVTRVARPTVWPTWIGVVLIVLGSLAAVGSVAGMLMPMFFGWLGDWMKSLDPEVPGGMFGAMSEHAALMILGQSFSLIAAVLAIVGGIALHKRRPSARMLVTTWAILKMFVGLLNSVVSGLIQVTQFEQMQEMDPATAGMQPFMIGMTIFGVVMGLVWIWALPIFILAWFSRAKVKAEVATWQAPS